MATRGPLSRSKRERERARVEKQKQKAARRDEARVRRSQIVSSPGGDDPDIAGIIPGPQANPWGDEPELDEAEETDEAEESDDTDRP